MGVASAGGAVGIGGVGTCGAFERRDIVERAGADGCFRRRLVLSVARRALDGVGGRLGLVWTETVLEESPEDVSLVQALEDFEDARGRRSRS